MKSLVSLISMGALLTFAAVAAEELERIPPLRDATTATECGECHMAFQPALLPARSWERIMDELRDHFGDDASVPLDMAVHISDYLTAHAGVTGDPSLIQITKQPWFTREHHFSPQAWKRPDVKTKSNCPASHIRADQGIYDDESRSSTDED